MTERRFRRRLGVTAIVAVAAVATFAVVGGTGLAGGLAKPFKSQYGPGGQYQGKVTICHKGWVTLRIAFAAWPAHLNRHDDTMGACSAAAVKAGKLKAAKQKAKQEAKAEKAAAKAEKKAKHASAKGQEVTVDETTASGTAGPPPGRGNGNGQGNGNGNGNGQGNGKKG